MARRHVSNPQSNYDSIARPAGLYESWDEVQGLIQLFELEKALYEVRYKLGNRPDGAVIAVRSLKELIQYVHLG